MLDVKHLIGEVAAKNGIRLEPDDPAFALVTLNQLVLEETVNELNEHVSSLLEQFTASLSKVEQRAGVLLAQQVNSSRTELRDEVASFFEVASQKAQEQSSQLTDAGTGPLLYKWMAIGGLSSMLLFLIGTVVGMMLAEHY